MVGVLLGVVSCASIPTDSAVTSGGPALPERPVRELVAGPAAGVRPAELVAAFLEAAPGAPDEYEVARSFLTPERAGQWRPEQGTVVYSGDAPAVRVSGEVIDVPGNGSGPVAGVDPEESPAAEAPPADTPAAADSDPAPEPQPVSASVRVEVAATVDADGRFVPAPTGQTQVVDFVLRRVGGQWRIDELPDVVLVSEPDFAFQYRNYPLWFLDPAREVLVPESRWLPNTGAAVTRLVSELLEGPSPWLAEAVVTAIPPGTQLAPPRSVITEAGAAVLELTGQAREASRDDRALMRAQMLATLQPVLGVREVELRVDGGELDVPAGRAVPTVDEATVADPVLVDDSSVLRLRGTRLVPVERVGSLAGLDASNPAVSLDGMRFAVLTSQRSQLRLLELGTGEWSEARLTGFDLTPPSFDRRGFVWTTSAPSDGTVRAVALSGDPVSVEATWLAGRRISTLRVSRDGARVVVASTDDDGLGHVDVAGVVRGGDGTPTRLVEAPSRSIAPQLERVDEAVWIGSGELAVLGGEQLTDAPRVHYVAVGGPRRPGRSELPGMTGIAGGQGQRSVLVTLDDGRVLTPSGTTWAQVVAGGLARDPAYPG